MGELWLPVPGYEGLYEVSDLGAIHSYPRPGSRGGLLKPGIDSSGYQIVVLHKRDGGKSFRVHQLVCLAFYGPCPPGQEIRHGPGGQLDNRTANLCYGTRSENSLDTVRHGNHREANRTSCDNGHDYTPENTYWNGRKRICRPCRREVQRRSWRRKTAA